MQAPPPPACHCTDFGGDPAAVHPGGPCPWPKLDRCPDCDADPLIACSFFNLASANGGEQCPAFGLRVLVCLRLRHSKVLAVTDNSVQDAARALGIGDLPVMCRQRLKDCVRARRNDGALPIELESAADTFYLRRAELPWRIMLTPADDATAVSMAALDALLHGRQPHQPTDQPQTELELLKAQMAALQASMESLLRAANQNAAQSGTRAAEDARATSQLLGGLQAPGSSLAGAGAPQILNLGLNTGAGSTTFNYGLLSHQQPVAMDPQRLQLLRAAGLTDAQIAAAMSAGQQQPQRHLPEWRVMTEGTNPLCLANVLVPEAQRGGRQITARTQLYDSIRGVWLKYMHCYTVAMQPEHFPATQLADLIALYKDTIAALNDRLRLFTPTLDAALVPFVPAPDVAFEATLGSVFRAAGDIRTGLVAWEKAHQTMVDSVCSIRGDRLSWPAAFADPNVQLELLRGRVATAPPNNGVNKSKRASGASGGNNRNAATSAEYCNNWNNKRGPCKDGPQCQRVHKCSTCGGDHRVLEHPQ